MRLLFNATLYQSLLDVPIKEAAKRSLESRTGHSQSATITSTNTNRFMALSAGTRLGSYEILTALGSGGMGEVYRARDVRLRRDVAVKILPPELQSDPDRLVRFEREARSLAALNHPNIAAIYGVEDQSGITALILELVEGETLATRLSRPLPVAEAVEVARQIAEALEAAHERGIIHRDLKPANIKIAPGGKVKVLDFGLAKVIAADPDGVDETRSTTLTADGTRAGVIVGTVAYMSPEQARGHPIDTRSDIWAFGCVLYEMLTGRRAFAGNTITDILAAVLEREPDWTRLPSALPPAVVVLLRRSLEKDPSRRWRNIGDVRIALEDAAQMTPRADRPVGKTGRWRERAAWAAFVLMSVAAASLAMRALRPTTSPPEIRFETALPAGVGANFVQLSLSPDGQQIVVAPTFEGRAPLWLRAMGSPAGTILPGTEGAIFPFWSPDGRSIGFFADRKLKRIDLDGQAVTELADVGVARGGAWRSDGTIMFAPNVTGPLLRVSSSAGGQPAPLTKLADGQTDHRAPFILPDGQHFLYYARGTPQARGVYVARLDGSEAKRLVDADAAAVFTGSGHLLFPRGGDLLAQLLNLERLELNGPAFRLAGPIAVNQGISLASLSASAGAVAYSTGGMRRTQFVWLDRSGKEIATLGPPDNTAIGNPTLSRDGQLLALSRNVGGNWDVWLLNMRGDFSRFTSDPALDFTPMFSSDSQRVVFQSTRGAAADLYIRGVNSNAPEELLLRTPFPKQPTDVSPDSRFVLYVERDATSGDLWYLPLTDERAPQPFVRSPYEETGGQFSPDGKWVAYQSNASGQFEIYAQPFPGPADRIPVSSGGGQQVRWGRSEIFYVGADQYMHAVPVKSVSGRLELAAPVRLFRTPFDQSIQFRQQYAVAADGQKFLMNIPTGAFETPVITVILNWKGRP